MTTLHTAGHGPSRHVLSPASPTWITLTTEDEVTRLLPEWDALWRRIPTATPFIAPAWLWSWWRHLGGGELRVFTARAGGQLVAVLPMFIWNDAGMRRLLPLGISVSDSFDLLADPAWLGPVLSSLGPMVGEADDWDRCELHEVPSDSPLLWLRDASLRPAVNRQGVSPVLDLAAFAARGSRSAPVRKLRRARARAEALGPVRIERIGPKTLHAVHGALDGLFALHSAQWQRRGETGVLMGSALRAFHRDVAVSMAARGVLLLLRLHVGASVAGVFYGFLRGGRAYAYATGIDPALSHIGPGTLLIGAAIDAARNAGARDFDFLRGAEAYKYAWGAVDRATVQITLAGAQPDLSTPGTAGPSHGRPVGEQASPQP